MPVMTTEHYYGRISNKKELRKYSKTSVHRWKTHAKETKATRRKVCIFIEFTFGINLVFVSASSEV
jgi:hypothetical protein